MEAIIGHQRAFGPECKEGSGDEAAKRVYGRKNTPSHRSRITTAVVLEF